MSDGEIFLNGKLILFRLGDKNLFARTQDSLSIFILIYKLAYKYGINNKQREEERTLERNNVATKFSSR